MTIYTMQHDTIDFSSTNPTQVEYYEKILSGVSLEDIKNNEIEGRHAILMNMSLAGDCPLSFDYLRARGLKDESRRKFTASFDRYTTIVIYNGNRLFIWDAAELYASEQTLKETGWIV